MWTTTQRLHAIMSLLSVLDIRFRSLDRLVEVESSVLKQKLTKARPILRKRDDPVLSLCGIRPKSIV